ncbi:HemK family protein methyltransferase [Candidatus Gracilibacteria bacterium]|nr:HemK family protein methyltransferase [Candidatus Gracilibacteria bacterium]
MPNTGNNPLQSGEEGKNDVSQISGNDLRTDFPEEYIFGSVIFFGRKFHITPDVLIPRLETEVLVKRVRKIISQYKKNNGEEKVLLVDIGTGSGIIITSCGDICDELIGIDISPSALLIARNNFETFFPEKKSTFLISDLLTVFDSEKLGNILSDFSRIVFVTNLPYIKADDWKNMSNDTHFEPKIALFGGEKTGFELYEKLFHQINSFKWQESQKIQLLIEFGFDQRNISEEILREYDWKYEFFADYRGIERFCDITLQQ